MAPVKSPNSAIGFTLIELVTVIIILGIVSVGISGFIRTGVGIYNDATERDQLIGDSRFVVERLNRELRQAIPNSVRSRISGTTHCLQFVPAQWVTFYTSLSVVPDTGNNATIVKVTGNNAGYAVSAGDFAIVYPTSDTDVYDLTNDKRQQIVAPACTDTGADTSCTTDDDPNNTAQLTFDGSFADDSPASRLYFARQAISYCASNGNIYRQETAINTTQPVFSSGVLMAENLANDLDDSDGSSDPPFRVFDATLSRNSLVHILLAFERNEEIINYSTEIHVPNVP